MVQIRISLLLFQELSSATDRVSDRLVEVNGSCSYGSLLQLAMYVMENQLFMSAQSVANIANNPSLVVVEEQMRNAKGSAVLFVLCSATSLVSLITTFFQEAQAVDSCDIPLRKQSPIHLR